MEQASQPIQPPVTTPETQTSPVPTPPVAQPSEPRSYMAIIALAFFAGPLGLARWYRGDESGKTRFWVYAVASLASTIPGINFVSLPVLLVLLIWGVVDFFKLYATTTDASGAPLTATAQDRQWAKNMRGWYIACLVLGVIVAIGALVLIGLVSQKALQDKGIESKMRSIQSSSY